MKNYKEQVLELAEGYSQKRRYARNTGMKALECFYDGMLLAIREMLLIRREFDILDAVKVIDIAE